MPQSQASALSRHQEEEETPKGKNDALKAMAPQSKHYKQKAKRIVSFPQNWLNGYPKDLTLSVHNKERKKSRKCQIHKPQPFPDTKRKRKQTKPNKRKSNKHTKSIKISSLFSKRGNSNAKRTEKHKNKIAQGKT